MIELTHVLVKELFYYKDGGLYWKENRGKNKTKDKRIGWQRPNNYRYASINNVSCMEHRLVFLYHHGYLPAFIDHIDGNKGNNAIENLREATKQQNEFNKGTNTTNTSGYKGVSYHKGDGKWRATMRVNGKQKHLGNFDTPEEAQAAYCKAAAALHKEFAYPSIRIFRQGEDREWGPVIQRVVEELRNA